jgi:hypothetical protein
MRGRICLGGSSVLRQSVRALAGVLCDKARLTSFGRAKIPLWLPLLSAIIVSQCIEQYLDGRPARPLGSSFRSKVMQVDDLQVM